MNRLPPLPLRGLPRALFLAFLASVSGAVFALTGALAELIRTYF